MKLLFALVLVSLANPLRVSQASLVNGAPVITSTLDSGSVLTFAHVTSFSVDAVDPDGDAVTLRLLNHERGMIYAPAIDSPASAHLPIEWRVDDVGPVRLVFEATDDGVPPESARLELDLILEYPSAIRMADVTGDGVPDLVAPASHADVGGAVDAGALHVWSGSSLPGTSTPVATLALPAPAAGAFLGRAIRDVLNDERDEPGILLEDVTGDGVADIVAVAVQAEVLGVAGAGLIAVWEGGSSLVGTPPARAILHRAQPWPDDRLGNSAGRSSLFVRDFNGDGVKDVIASAYRAKHLTWIQPFAGGPHLGFGGLIGVWFGGDTMQGQLAMDLELVIPHGERLQSVGRVTRFADVTGDGHDDIITTASHLHRGNVPSVGAIVVWAGGPAAKKAPTAMLWGDGPEDTFPQIDHSDPYRAFHLADVTGDGVRDVVAANSKSDAANVRAGEVLVWRGGPAMKDAPDPYARLQSATPDVDDHLGSAGTVIADVTGDGGLDILAGSTWAENLGKSSGEVLVWEGGPALAGVVTSLATLNLPSPEDNDRLGEASGVRLADVTGDDDLDVIVGSDTKDLARGRFYVWEGGAALNGDIPPAAELYVSGASTFSFLGSNGEVDVGDVTGDGQLDIVLGAHGADVASVNEVGAVYVWEGGALNGPTTEHGALSVPGAKAKDHLAQSGQVLLDLTGDGQLDVYAAAAWADQGGETNVGRAYFWEGGPGLGSSPPPTASFIPTFGEASTRFGSFVSFRDANADGTLDFLGMDPFADANGINFSGCMYLWLGGASLAGMPAPSTIWTGLGAKTGDLLTEPHENYHRMRWLDLDGDGRLDLVGVAAYANLGGVNTGVLHVWYGDATSKTDSDLVLRVPGASADDFLGS